MTKRNTFTKAQIRFAAEIAKQHGVRVRLEVDGAMTFEPAPTETGDDLDADWAAYEARNLD